MAASRRWRPAVWVTTAVAAVGLATVFATAASAAAPGPAAGVAPGAVTAGSSNEVFYTAADGSVWQKNVTANTPATGVGGGLVGATSPIYDGTNILVFGEGTDGALWHTTCGSGGGCQAWQSLGGRLTSKPGAAFVTGMSYSVYARSTDGAVWARDHTGTGWGAWHSVGGQVLSGTGPSAAYDGTSQYVLVAGTDKKLYLDKVGGPGFDPVGGMTTASPALTNDPAGLLGYARGTDNAGYYEFVSTPTGWHSLGGFLTSGMAAATNGSTSYGYGLGGNSQVYQNASQVPGAWTEVTP